MPLTYPIGFINKYDPDKNYQNLLFQDARPIQGSELNELQDGIRSSLRSLGNNLIGDGTIVSGGQITELRTTLISLTEAELYVDGTTLKIPAATISLIGSGVEIVGVKVTRKIITSVEDPTLVQTNVRSAAFGRPGADRLQLTGIWALSTTPLLTNNVQDEFFVPINTLNNAALVQVGNETSVVESTVKKILGNWDYDRYGNYVLKGLETTFIGLDENDDFVFNVSAGRARVGGKDFNFPVNQSITVDKVSDTGIGNEYAQFTGIGSYPLRKTPVHSIAQIVCTKQASGPDREIIKGIAGSTDILPVENVNASTVIVTQSSTTFIEGDDYVVVGNGIDWSPGGNEPNPGSTYQVDYQYSTSIPATNDFENAIISDVDIVNGSTMLITYAFYLQRTDRLAINYNGLRVLKGVPSERPYPPRLTDEDLSLSILELGFHLPPGVDFPPVITEDSTVAIQLSELNSIRQSIEDLQYNVAELSLLENARQNDPTTTKKNLIVDPLLDTDMFDEGLTNNMLVVDQELEISSDLSSGAAVSDTRHILSATEITSVSQENRTSERKINPFAVRVLTPDPLNFVIVTDADPNEVVESNEVVIRGLTETADLLMQSTGTVSINGGSFVTAGTVNSGDHLVIRKTASSEFGTADSAVVQIGNGVFTWEIVTRSADVIPDDFLNAFVDVFGAEKNTVTTSVTHTITGVEPDYDFDVVATGGLVDAGMLALSGSFAATKTVTSSAQGEFVIAARLTSSANFDTASHCTVSINGISDVFTVTTRSADVTPDAFTIPRKVDVPLSTIVESDTVTVTGLEPNYPFQVVGSGGLVDSGTSALSGTFAASKSVTSGGLGEIVIAGQLMSSADPEMPVSMTIEIGEYSTDFQAITEPVELPTATRFSDVLAAPRSSVLVSDTIIVDGLTPSGTVDVTVVGGTVDAGTYSLSGTFEASKLGVPVSPAGEIVVAVSGTTSSNFNVTTYVKAIVDGNSATWAITTRKPIWLPILPTGYSYRNANPSTHYAGPLLVFSGIEPVHQIEISTVTPGFDFYAGSAVLGSALETTQTLFTSASGTFVFKPHGLSSSSLGTKTTGIYRVKDLVTGAVFQYTFTIRTRSADLLPAEFLIPAKNGVETNTSPESDIVQVTGLEPSHVVTVSTTTANSGQIKAHASSAQVENQSWATSANVTTSSNGTLHFKAKLDAGASAGSLSETITVGSRNAKYNVTVIDSPEAVNPRTAKAWLSRWDIRHDLRHWRYHVVKLEEDISNQVKIFGKHFTANDTVTVVTHWGHEVQTYSTDGNGDFNGYLNLFGNWGLKWGYHRWQARDDATGKTIYFQIYLYPFYSRCRSWAGKCYDFARAWVRKNIFLSRTTPKDDPVAHTFEFDDTREVNSVSIYFTEKPTNTVSIKIVETQVGIPDKNRLISIGDIEPESAITGWNKVTLDIPARCEGGKEYSIIVFTEDFIGSVGTSVLGQVDKDTGIEVSNQPHSGVFLVSANENTWTPAQDEDLTFKLHTNSYSTTPTEILVLSVNVTNITDWLLSATLDTPAGTTIQFFLESPDGTKYDINPDEIAYTPELTGVVELRAVLITVNENVSPKILEGATLSYGTANLPGVYTQRTFSTTGDVGSAVDFKVVVDETLPLDDPQNTVQAFYFNGVDYTEMTRGTSTQLSDRKWATEFNASAIELTTSHLRLECNTTDPENRPKVGKIRTLIT